MDPQVFQQWGAVSTLPHTWGAAVSPFQVWGVLPKQQHMPLVIFKVCGAAVSPFQVLGALPKEWHVPLVILKAWGAGVSSFQVWGALHKQRHVPLVILKLPILSTFLRKSLHCYRTPSLTNLS
jgi:hypothetical protein